MWYLHVNVNVKEKKKLLRLGGYIVVMDAGEVTPLPLVIWTPSLHLKVISAARLVPQRVPGKPLPQSC